MFSTAAEQKQLRITPIVADSVRRLGVTWVRGDPNRFSQVIINLLSNAIKFSIDRGSEITVRLEASPTPPVFSENGNSSTSSTVQLSALEATSPQDAYVIVSVGDQGMGMTGDERKRMFRRFSQASQKTYSNFGGSGLGLYICKVLVEKQGGDITVESEPGKGTLFTFYMRYELIPRVRLAQRRGGDNGPLPADLTNASTERAGRDSVLTLQRLCRDRWNSYRSHCRGQPHQPACAAAAAEEPALLERRRQQRSGGGGDGPKGA